GSAVVDNSKEVTFTSGNGTVVIAAFARVSGTNGINDEQIQMAHGSLSSVGALLGNLSGSVVAPFNGSLFQNGSVQDIDGDTDLDIGSTGTTSVGKFVARADSPV